MALNTNRFGLTARRGFTLVELLIVIVIIGVLTTLSLISFRSARLGARDARRVADVEQVQLALKTYYNDNGFYPTAVTPGQSISLNGKSYLLRVPENPAPKNDNDCPDQDYAYTVLENGQRYSLNFCLGSRSDNLTAGKYSATANGILGCPEGYVRVIGSADVNTIDFCAMKYEAKCQTEGNSPLTSSGAYDNQAAPCEGAGTAVVSTAAGLPIANITLAQARAYCENIGAHLMTNAEWTTIARDAERREENWWGDPIWYGSLSRGNFEQGPVLDGTYEYLVKNGSDPLYRRSMTLSSGEKIWDISGNAAELVYDQCQTGDGPGKYLDTGGAPYNWHEAALLDYELDASGPKDFLESPDDLYYGNYKGCSANGNATTRGGGVDDYDPNLTGVYANGAGIYFMDMTMAEGDMLPGTGFRCAK